MANNKHTKIPVSTIVGDKKYDLKKKLQIYFPVLFHLLNGRDLDWKMITKSFKKKLYEHTVKYEQQGRPIQIEVSFYSLVIGVAKGKREAETFFLFLKKLFEELNYRLDDREKTLIRGSLTGIFSNIDLKYLNFVGELCVLNYIKRNHGYILNATEYPHDLSNRKGPSIDFCFVGSSNGDIFLIEVVNIHLFNASSWTEEKIERAITQKISEKLRNKGFDKNPSFTLIPVLWGAHDDIKSIAEFYERKKPHFVNTAIPLCFMAFSDAKGNAVHMFGDMQELMKSL